MLAITGANGHLGQRLLSHLDRQDSAVSGVRALVRSERAAAQVRALGLARAPELQVVDYLDPAAMAAALQGCTAVVHLVGIIKESSSSRYGEAHEQTCRTLAAAAAAAGVERIVYLSILGARPDAANACLASKGRAEQILAAGAVPAVTLRVPMVLGEGDHAAQALARRARKRWNVLLRGSSLEQPIYAGDVVRAMMAAVTLPVDAAAGLDLAGLESLSRAALTRQAAALLGRRTRVLSLPLGIGMVLAQVLERLLRDPPVSRAMLGVLDHDDRIDAQPTAKLLGIRLTPLTETLRRCLGS
ncbi:MAG: NAD(P)H-binding protein [Pseudomonadales bacterium]